MKTIALPKKQSERLFLEPRLKPKLDRLSHDADSEEMGDVTKREGPNFSSCLLHLSVQSISAVHVCTAQLSEERGLSL